MQRNFLGYALLGLTLVGIAATAWLSYATVLTMKEGRQLQAQVKSLSDIKKVLNSLLQETAEYSKKNPAIDPLLQQYGLKKPQAPAQPATSNRK